MYVSMGQAPNPAQIAREAEARAQAEAARLAAARAQAEAAARAAAAGAAAKAPPPKPPLRVPASYVPPGTENIPAATPESKTMLYVGIALGVAVLGVGGYLLLRN